MRRLRALAVLDAEVGVVIAGRDERLRTALTVVLKGSPHLVKVVHALIRFETFDALAGTERGPREVVPTVTGLVDAALKMDSQPPGRSRRQTG